MSWARVKLELGKIHATVGLDPGKSQVRARLESGQSWA